MKRIGIILLILVISISLFIWYIKVNPPLYISGWGTTDYPDKHGLVVEIHNRGFAGLKLEKVYINEYETPEAVELGISKTSALVEMFTQSENEAMGITFHKLNEFQIKPDLTPEQKQKISYEVVKSYGIWVQNFGKSINKVIIKYKYLGIPFLKSQILDYQL